MMSSSSADAAAKMTIRRAVKFDALDLI